VAPIMTKQQLPTCSIEGCLNSAGINFDGILLCGEHANEALERRRDALLDCDIDENHDKT